MGNRKIFVSIFCIILLSYTSDAFAQVGFVFGGSTSNVMHNHVLINENGKDNNAFLPGYFAGMSYKFNPFDANNKVSLSVELLYNRKGYKQIFSDSTYVKKWNYISLPILLNYEVTDEFSVEAGPEFSTYLKPLLEDGGLHNGLDLGFSAGGNYQFTHNWNIFLRSTLGLLPVVNYYKIDDLGNITPYRDLRNLSIMIGVKFNLN